MKRFLLSGLFAVLVTFGVAGTSFSNYHPNVNFFSQMWYVISRTNDSITLAENIGYLKTFSSTPFNTETGIFEGYVARFVMEFAPRNEGVVINNFYIQLEEYGSRNAYTMNDDYTLDIWYFFSNKAEVRGLLISKDGRILMITPKILLKTDDPDIIKKSEFAQKILKEAFEQKVLTK